MVAQFLRLKLTLLANTFRRSPVQLLGMLIALLYGVGLAVFIATGLVTLRFATPEIARTMVVVFGAVVVLGFLLLPLAFGIDDTLDPRRFSLFGIRNTRLSFALAVAALISVPSLVVTIFAVAQIVTWSRDPLSGTLAVIASVLIVATCVLGARVSAGLASLFLSARRAREITGIAVIATFALLAPLLAVFATIDWGSRGLPIMRRIAAVASWTPHGAAWSIPADAAVGHPEFVLPKLIIAIGFIAGLWIVWRVLIGVMLVTPQRESAARLYSGLGWFERMPATPWGAVAARSLSYWGRDARYRVGLVVIPIVPIIMIGALMIAGVPQTYLAWIPVPVMCLFLGWTIHNDVAHDSTAFWAHVSANISGRADRFGRLIPPLLLGAIVVSAGSVVTTLITGNWPALPGLIGVSTFVLLVGLAISSVISAGFPYPAVHPGDSPFDQPQSAGGTGSVVQGLSFFTTVFSSAPLFYLVYLGETQSDTWHVATLAVGVGGGVAALLGGVLWGGAILSKRSPELLAFTLQN